MALTERFYGAHTARTSRAIQDFGLCDTNGVYQYTAKLRAKGLLVVVFFAPDSPPSVAALKTVQAWTTETPTQKWTAIAVAEGDRPELARFAEAEGLSNITVVLDYELYQTRMWGVSQLPSVYLVSGQTGRVLDRVLGEEDARLDGMKQMLADEVAKIVAAEAAAKAAAEEAKKAEEEKKAAEAAKAAEAKAADPEPAA